jgi:hypothetical protein
VAFVGTKSDKSVRRNFHFEDVSLGTACCFTRQKDKLPDRHAGLPRAKASGRAILHNRSAAVTMATRGSCKGETKRVN